MLALALVLGGALGALAPGGASSFKIYAAGSGLDMLSQPETVAEVIALSGKPAPHVLYLGTATYDDAGKQATQSQGFVTAGCTVTALQVAYRSPSASQLAAAFAGVDIVLVSGGNTLFAVDRWNKLGVADLIRQAGAAGAVLAGGSAGGIVWFDGGHSDSMDPLSYKNPPGPILNPALNDTALAKSWAYLRVPGLSALPGLFCPHYDVTEGNGVLRATSFTTTLRHHSGEFGIAVDNWAALRIDGARYTLISRAGRSGSVGPGGEWTSNSTLGRPGSWTLSIDGEGALRRTLTPKEGSVANLLTPARYVAPSAMLPVARAQNPDDGVAPTGTRKQELEL